MASRHHPSCAAQWRRRAAEQSWGNERLVQEIHHCCQVSRLRAHRLARGWTLSEAVGQLQGLCAQLHIDAPRTDPDQWGLWETRPDRRPRPSTVDLLCRLYATDATGLGISLGGDYRKGTPEPAATRLAPLAKPPDLAAPIAPAPARKDASFEELIESTRRVVDRTLASASVTPSQLDVLDERLMWLRQLYVSSPPLPMLHALLSELGEVHALSSDRQPAGVQGRLSEMTAVLATLIADALMKLGQLRQSRAWYGTARTAADDSGNVELRARVRAQAAMLPYYYGPLEAAAALAREARLLLRQRATTTGAFAAAAEARAQARQGNSAVAERALRQAQEIFEQTDRGSDEDAFSFPERRLLLYLSGALTHLGQLKRARAVQRQALSLYPGQLGIDPVLIRLEEAICLAQEHSPQEACQLAGSTYLSVPEEHRTPIVEARVRNVIEAIPPRMRSGRPARELGEILALPASNM